MSVIARCRPRSRPVVAAAHSSLSSLSADPAAGTTWLLCIAGVVAVVRVAILPLAIHGVRLARLARARPELQELAKKYRNRKDPESMRAFLRGDARRCRAQPVAARVLLLVVQLPIWLALYHLLAGAAGDPVGAMGRTWWPPWARRPCWVSRWPSAATSAPGRTWPGRWAGVCGRSPGVRDARHFVVPNTVVTDLPEVMSRTQQLMPAASALGLVVAGGVVPVALLVYWVCNGAWTMGQAAVVWRWFPPLGRQPLVPRVLTAAAEASHHGNGPPTSALPAVAGGVHAVSRRQIQLDGTRRPSRTYDATDTSLVVVFRAAQLAADRRAALVILAEQEVIVRRHRALSVAEQGQRDDVERVLAIRGSRSRSPSRDRRDGPSAPGPRRGEPDPPQVGGRRPPPPAVDIGRPLVPLVGTCGRNRRAPVRQPRQHLVRNHLGGHQPEVDPDRLEQRRVRPAVLQGR